MYTMSLYCTSTLYTIHIQLYSVDQSQEAFVDPHLLQGLELLVGCGVPSLGELAEIHVAGVQGHSVPGALPG